MNCIHIGNLIFQFMLKYQNGKLNKEEKMNFNFKHKKVEENV